MSLCFLEIVISVQWIKPRVKEEPRPVPMANYEASLTEPFTVLSEHQIYLITLQMGERLDNTVWWYHRLVLQHQRFQPKLL